MRWRGPGHGIKFLQEEMSDTPEQVRQSPHGNASSDTTLPDTPTAANVAGQELLE